MTCHFVWEKLTQTQKSFECWRMFGHPTCPLIFHLAMGKRTLRFQYRWLNRFKCLAYSKVADGTFCRYCALFGNKEGAGVGNQPIGALCVIKFNKCKDALERFADHEGSKYHCDSVLKAECALSIESGKQDSVAVQLNHQAKQLILDKSRKITPIIETVIFCGRQGIPLRGHPDSGPLSFVEADLGDINDGNFWALIRYRGKYDEVFKNDITSAGRNSQYISPRVQNEILSACNDLIWVRLVDYINRSRFFTVLAEEKSDIWCQEQLSLCARFVGDDFTVEEYFLKFVPITDLSGKELASTVLKNVSQIGIDISKMRGQGYDGAAAVSGRLNGAHVHIREVILLQPFVCTVLRMALI